MAQITAAETAEIKDQQRRTWDAVSVGWERSSGLFERSAEEVTARLLRLGGLHAGQAVLDIGTGLGEPALSAARLVGDDGRVLGIDLSPAMIEAARRRAVAAGADNVVFDVADIESCGLPQGAFDVVLSRWGLMFTVDHVGAFRAVARLLAPGGALAGTVWGPPPSAPVIAFSFGEISRRLELPPPPSGTPGPFSMADTAVLHAELAGGGFDNVTVEERVVPFRFAGADEFERFSRDVAPPGLLQAIRERCGGDDAELWAAVGAAARERFADAGGLLLPSTVLYLRGTTPG